MCAKEPWTFGSALHDDRQARLVHRRFLNPTCVSLTIDSRAAHDRWPLRRKASAMNLCTCRSLLAPCLPCRRGCLSSSSSRRSRICGRRFRGIRSRRAAACHAASISYHRCSGKRRHLDAVAGTKGSTPDSRPLRDSCTPLLVGCPWYAARHSTDRHQRRTHVPGNASQNEPQAIEPVSSRSASHRQHLGRIHSSASCRVQQGGTRR